VTMTANFDQVLDQARAALDQIARGDASGYAALYSRRADITVANPFGGVGRGWNEVMEQVERAASYYRDGKVTRFDIITKTLTPELAYTVTIEGIDTKLAGGSDVVPLAVRVTSVYHREDGDWKLVHRHADPAIGRQPAESILKS
jgi:uncharacterized protein (TIGR02246 family)